jgi:hypothetical protein
VSAPGGQGSELWPYRGGTLTTLPRSSFFSMSPSLLTSRSLKIFEIA